MTIDDGRWEVDGDQDKALREHLRLVAEKAGKMSRPAFTLHHLNWSFDHTLCGIRHSVRDAEKDLMTDEVAKATCSQCLRLQVLALPAPPVTDDEIAEVFGPTALLPIPIPTPVEDFVTEVQRVVDDYRTVWPQPHALAANLILLAKACELLGQPLTRGT